MTFTHGLPIGSSASFVYPLRGWGKPALVKSFSGLNSYLSHKCFIRWVPGPRFNIIATSQISIATLCLLSTALSPPHLSCFHHRHETFQNVHHLDLIAVFIVTLAIKRTKTYHPDFRHSITIKCTTTSPNLPIFTTPASLLYCHHHHQIHHTLTIITKLTKSFTTLTSLLCSGTILTKLTQLLLLHCRAHHHHQSFHHLYITATLNHHQNYYYCHHSPLEKMVLINKLV